MRELQEIRPDIDRIDKELAGLLKERMSLCREVAEYKSQTGKKVLDKAREQEKMEKIKAMADNPFEAVCLEELFTQLLSMSRKMQYQILSRKGALEDYSFQPVESLPLKDITVVYQGVEGAYSHQAMLQYFGSSVKNFQAKTFREAMEAIQEQKADYAVLPIENSSAGSVNDIYDLLVEFENCIVAETFVKVEHCLLGLRDAELSDIEIVYSHPQGLMQCQKFLEAHGDWQKIGQLNTAGSAKKVLEEGKKNQAAIASALAGELYGLKVLEQGINQKKDNTTRFVIISKDKIYRKDAGKTTLCFELSHKSGTLYNMLSHLIFNGLNMTKIESRPLEGKNWEYRFFVDVEGNLGSPGMINALRGMEEEANAFRILGNY